MSSVLWEIFVAFVVCFLFLSLFLLASRQGRKSWHTRPRSQRSNMNSPHASNQTSTPTLSSHASHWTSTLMLSKANAINLLLQQLPTVQTLPHGQCFLPLTVQALILLHHGQCSLLLAVQALLSPQHYNFKRILDLGD